MLRGAPILLVCGLLTSAGCTGDRVIVTGGDGIPEGVLVDGTASGTAHNDDRATGTGGGAAIGVGPYDTGNVEVIAYTQGHAPTLHSAGNWSAADDDVTFAFDSKHRVPFRVWIVKGTFADGQTKAVNACIRTSQIWRDERQGLSFQTFQISDATGDPDAASFVEFTCAKAADIKNDIGFDANAVNVYYVNTVDFGSGALTSNGVWCGGEGIVAMGWNTSDHLFSHEIGHAYQLDHVNGDVSFFDTTNVMHNASNNRQYLAEGQTFRAAFHPSSVANTLGTRTGPTRTCNHSTSTTNATCPAVQKRIWADGASWPPN